MKFRTTKKAMKENYTHIIKVGYCNLQNLLYFTEPIAYSTRAEGWACDYYDIDGVLISTGYDPINSRNTHSSYDIERKYDNEAEKIVHNLDITYEEKKARVNELLKEYIEEVTK